RKSSLKEFRKSASPETQAAVQSLQGVFAEARKIADAPSNYSTAQIQAALRLLGREADGQAEDRKRLSEWLRPQVPAELQKAALMALARLPGADAEFLGAWNAASPGLRADILNVLFTRQD